ncbi:polyphenol oxidase family protein [Verrucomicrobiaceae bacterium 5K15]|uniref:Polyphenol oxidase family protein n=1 Tax=Oceaniferula flava TaxID=2800421 RepID=A0AAE2V9Z2_9BACT|nr:polyphenol oxidase family protein [Oceaniferula flavus]MBM1137295.1 polyphenol oxidase family protein [Oceaniferula flavus]
MTQAPLYLQPIHAQPGFYADFIGRIPGVSVDTDREATVNRLQPAHEARVRELGFDWSQLHRAEQIHSAEIAVIGQGDAAPTWPQVDGLITDQSDVLLGIYVADCGAVYISDPVKRVVALLHSGKKGSEENITGKAILIMKERFGCRPADLQVALAPCIRPPAYEVDFAAEIQNQALAAGVPVEQFTDCHICTTSDLEQYYSYRVEKGSTGRMLALLGMNQENGEA